MSRGLRLRLWDLRWAVLALSLALVVSALFHPIRFGLALRLWLIAVIGLAASPMVAEAVSQYDTLVIPKPRWRRAKATVAERPAALAEVERAVKFASWSAFDVRLRLSPLLREIAGHRLAGRRGIDIESRPDLAAGVLGADLWKLIDPSGALPIRDTPGVSPAVIRAAVERLEAL